MPHIKKLIRRWLNFLVGCLAIPLAPLFGYVARHGAGSNVCLRSGFLPLPVHFYSPVPDIKDLKVRQVWSCRSELPGVSFRPKEQLALLSEIGKQYGHECNWPIKSTGDPKQYFSENSSFSFGCAASTYGILRYFKPHKVVEIGSGNSSLIISSALKINHQENSELVEYTIIDPFPGPIVKNGLPCLTQLIKERVELQSIDQFTKLSINDVLFIDSGHTIRTGGDVNFLFLEVLPRLSPGVIVHFHDIPLPWDYPEVYFTRPLRFLWTESYLLQAFLIYNNAFEVMLAMRYLQTDHIEAFRASFPFFKPDVQLANSGSFWIRRKI